MVSATGIGEGSPALCPGQPCRLLRVARRGGPCRRGGGRLDRNDDSRGDVPRWIPGGASFVGVILHEAVHGVFFLAFGGRPRFGFKPWTRFGPVFYAAAPGSYLRQAPVPRLRLGAGGAVDRGAGGSTRFRWPRTTCSPPSSLWAFVLNVAGSSGDMLMMRKVMSYPGTTRFEDTGEGFVAYGPDGGRNCSELMPTQPVHPKWAPRFGLPTQPVRPE